MFRVLEPAKMGQLELRNRFMRSATWDATADEAGAVTDRSLKIYEGLASGGVGLIATAFMFVAKNGQSTHGQYGIYSDEMIPGLRRLVEVAHRHGAKIAAQIVHSGIGSGYLHGKGEVLLAPSKIENRWPHRAMTDEEIDGLVDSFAAAAVRAREAGFDGVQLHGAHGYLLSQFFSTLSNRREDRWGGSPENRRRFHLETIRRIRASVGNDYPLMIKFGVMDDAGGGSPLEEGIAALKAMEEAGLDAVEISGGIGSGKRGSVRALNDEVKEEVYFRERAAHAKKAVSIPLAVVGGVRYLETAEDIVTSGDADFISLSRPLIREPDLINRWLNGDHRRAKCISCNKCSTIVARGELFECGEERRLAGRGDVEVE